jgi:hypothetical protein
MPIIGDVFGLNSIYEKQVENIDNNNFESWPESATYGYFACGQHPTGNPDYFTTVDRIDFSNETTSAPGGNLTQARTGLAAVSSNFYGYFGGGGAFPPPFVTTIDRIDFSNEVTSASGYNLTQGRSGLAACSSSSYGYFGGGKSPGYTGTIERIDFSNDTTSPVTDTLTESRGNFAACSSSSYGYFGGGRNPSFVATLDRIDFSNEVTSAPGYNLTQARGFISACSSNSYGYFGGGSNPSLSPDYADTIDRIDFSNEVTSAPVTDTLTQARSGLAACSSSSYGYFGGGFVPPGVATVDRIDFSNEVTSAPGYNLTQARYNLAAVSGGASYRIKGSRTYGYFGGGFADQSTPNWLATVDRIDFSNETTSGPGNNLSQARHSLAACSSNSYGYFAGGSTQPPPPDTIIQSTMDRIDFSNETTSAPGYNLTQARYGLAACSSSSYGYFGGGTTTPFGNNQTDTIDRLDFSNETTSTPGNNLPEARQRLAACSSNSYGYFGGGVIEGSPSDIESDTIERLDFSNETLISTATLSQGRFRLAAVSSNSYGYFTGGKFVFPVSSHTNRIDRFDFSNETATNAPATLPQSRSSFSAVSSSSYGYFGGGNYGPIYVTTIDRIDFSNDTTSPVTDTLSNDVSSSAAVSN